MELDDQQLTQLLGAYGIDLWPRVPVATVEEAQAAAAELGWDVVLKSTRPAVRERPDRQHVWRNIESPTEMKEAWATLAHYVPRPAVARSWCRRTRHPACPSRSGRSRTRCSGPWCRSASPARSSSCWATGRSGSRR
nr:acetate--CoA ligase family protein [Nocardioides sp. TF02-7]